MKVLLLEDHDAMRELISGHLAHCGFVVDAVGRGGEALAAVAATRYDAMILDLGLPDIDGLEVLKRLRARGAAQLPTLIVTARDAVDDRVRGLNAGADDYIIKPFDLVELEARLRAVLRRPGGREVVAQGFGRLIYDPASRQAFVDGVDLDLTRREAALLEEFIHAGAQRVVIKDKLEERLYSFENDVTSNALEAVVSRLRKKLAGARAGVRIDAKRGIGYCLVGEDA